MTLFRTLEQKHRGELDDAPPERPKLRDRLRSAFSLPPVPTWRWVAGTLTMLLAGVLVSVSLDNNIGGGAYWGFSGSEACTFLLAGFVTGCIVRRWQAVLLVLPPILIAIPFGLPDGNTGFYLDSDPVFYGMAVLAPICGGFIAAGVAVGGWVAGSMRRHISAPEAG